MQMQVQVYKAIINWAYKTSLIQNQAQNTS